MNLKDEFSNSNVRNQVDTLAEVTLPTTFLDKIVTDLKIDAFNNINIQFLGFGNISIKGMQDCGTYREYVYNVSDGSLKKIECAEAFI